MSNRDVVSKAEVLDVYTELYDNVVSKAKVLDVYNELYDKFVLMFVQALFETFRNEAAASCQKKPANPSVKSDDSDENG